MRLSVQIIIWVAGVVGLSCLACERSMPPKTFACESPTQFQNVLANIRQHSQQPKSLRQQPELLQQLADCAHSNPKRLKAIVTNLTGPLLTEALAVSPQLVESFAAIPPASLGKAIQPFLFASFNATHSAKDSRALQTQLLGYLGAVDIVEMADLIYGSGSSDGSRLVDWFAIAFQHSPQAESNPLPAIYRQLSEKTLAFRQGNPLDRVKAFLQHPQQESLCGYLAQYLIRGWQKANLSDQAKADHLKLATSHLIKNGTFPSGQQPSNTIVLAQVTSRLLQIESDETGRGYRRLLILATFPVGKDINKDRIPDRVLRTHKDLPDNFTRQLQTDYYGCLCSYRDVQ